MSDLSYAPISSVPVSDGFFDTLRADYPGFDDWLRRKAAEAAYVARRENGGIDGFLYLKLEDGAVTDVQPTLAPAKRLKVGTLKVNPHGTRLGERLLKKVFDHATEHDVAEIYVTVFPKHAKLIELFARYGFTKTGPGGVEDVMVRSLLALLGDVTRNYPLINMSGRKFLLSLYPQWHTRLLPDSKLHTESPDIVKDVSHTNSIHKVYLAGMKGIEQLRRGDLLLIYRTGDGKGPAHYRAVATSICTVEEVRDISSFANVDELLEYCAPYSVFTEQELRGFWTNRKYPALIRFTYTAALKKRLTRADLIDHNVIDANAYAGFATLTDAGFKVVVERGGIHASLVVHQPEYAEKILNGTKRFEYRKAVPRNESVRTVVIYATMPVGKVIGEFEVGGVLCEKPKDLWKRTKEASGITREFFDSYFDGRERAMAIAVKKPKRYATPKNPRGRVRLSDAAAVLPVPGRRSRGLTRSTTAPHRPVSMQAGLDAAAAVEGLKQESAAA